LKQNQEKCIQEIIELVSFNPKSLICFNENIFTTNSVLIDNEREKPIKKSVLSIEKEFQTLKENIEKEYENYQSKENKKLQKLMKLHKKQKLPHFDPDNYRKTFKQLQILFFRSFGELAYYFKNLLTFGQFQVPTMIQRKQKEEYLEKLNAQWKSNPFLAKPLLINPVTEYFMNFIPVVFVDNLQVIDVIPTEPNYVEYESDEDEMSISIGKHEYRNFTKEKWLCTKPHRVSLELAINDNPTLPPVTYINEKGEKKVEKLEKKAQLLPVFADVLASLVEFYFLIINSKIPQEPVQGAKNKKKTYSEENYCSNKIIWIDNNPHALFNESSSFYQLSSAIFNAKKFSLFDSIRYLSRPLRESLLWCSVIQLMPRFKEITRESNYNSSNSSQLITDLQYSSFPDHLKHFFYKAIQEGRQPNSLFILGGELRLDKFRVLDELLTLVNVVELFIGFIFCNFCCFFCRWILFF
jgi:hypothetical protein